MKSNNTAEERGVRKYFTEKEQTEKLAGERKAREKVTASTSVANDRAQLYDPLASLELYGVTCQIKRRERPAVEKLTKQSGTAEIRIDDRKAAEFEEDIEMIQKSGQVRAHEIRKSAAACERNIQTHPRKSEKYKRHDKTSHIDKKISGATGLGRKGRKKEREGREQEKWIDKYKYRKQR